MDCNLNQSGLDLTGYEPKYCKPSYLSTLSQVIFMIPTPHLVLKGGREAVVEHFLVENRCDTSRHGRHDPHPVCRTAASHPVLVLHVFHEGFCGRMVIYYGHFGRLKTGNSKANVKVLICVGWILIVLNQSAMGISKTDDYMKRWCFDFKWTHREEPTWKL